MIIRVGAFLEKFQKSSDPDKNDGSWSFFLVFHVVFSSFSHLSLRGGKKTKKRQQSLQILVNTMKIGQFFGFFVFFPPLFKGWEKDEQTTTETSDPGKNDENLSFFGFFHVFFSSFSLLS